MARAADAGAEILLRALQIQRKIDSYSLAAFPSDLTPLAGTEKGPLVRLSVENELPENARDIILAENDKASNAGTGIVARSI